MSFVGYYQLLCEEGHYTTIDVSYYDHTNNIKCSTCNKRFVWKNLVDQTNVYNEGIVHLEIDKPEVIKKCDKCGHICIVSYATYKIPQKKSITSDEDKQDFFDPYRLEKLDSEHEYDEALRKITLLLDAKEGTPEEEELKRLSNLVYDYEDKFYPFV